MAAIESITGVKLAGLIGGLFGSLVTLSYLPSLKNWQRVGAYQPYAWRQIGRAHV